MECDVRCGAWRYVLVISRTREIRQYREDVSVHIEMICLELSVRTLKVRNVSNVQQK
jgi:hypothetical protein